MASFGSLVKRAILNGDVGCWVTDALDTLALHPDAAGADCGGYAFGRALERLLDEF